MGQALLLKPISRDFSSQHPLIDPTNIPNIKIIFPRITCHTLLPCPPHTSLPVHFPLLVSYTPSCTPLHLTPPLHVHLLYTSPDKSATRETANPAADSRPIPSPSRANTTCSSESRGPSSRIFRHSPNSAH